MNRNAAEQALDKVEAGSSFEYVGKGTTVVVGKNANGYWVADNGDETSGLSRSEANRLAAEAERYAGWYDVARELQTLRDSE